MVTHGWQRADIQRMRDGWDEAFDPEVWERLSGGRVAPPGFVDTPGVSRAPDKGDVGTPTPENPWDWMCSCHEPVSKRFRVGSACGDEGKGRVARVSEFSARTGDALCVGGYDCVGGDGCACYKTAKDVGIFYTDTECANHEGQTPDSAVDCASATFVGGEACSCRIQCNDGTWVQTGSAKASGYRFCRGEAYGEAWGDTAESVSDLACDPPRAGPLWLQLFAAEAEAGLVHRVFGVQGCIYNHTTDVPVKLYACEDGVGPVRMMRLGPGDKAPCGPGDPDWDFVNVEYGDVDVWYKKTDTGSLSLHGDRVEGVTVTGDACGGRPVAGVCAGCSP